MNPLSDNVAFIPPWELYFSDGSGNAFQAFQRQELSNIEFFYDPVRQSLSSSGTYSGGTPKRDTLSLNDTATLQQLVRELLCNKYLHRTLPRPMGSGYFKITSANEQSEFVIAMGSELDTFQTFIQKICR